ncbi:hypothetical protein POTOM_044915 [Populus tomentosa]|uniref:Uncharacterized protein n=1 Tax=Populus tomentosa TaxID=118781 RepID=A0A8X7YK39_POPTO|nr:hypothetical protein POTOM_044915 [Populus tomentosa]
MKEGTSQATFPSLQYPLFKTIFESHFIVGKPTTMASNAFQRGKMKEENPNTCRDIIASNDPPNSQLCNVSCSTMPEQRLESEYLSCWPGQCGEEAMIALLITLMITPGSRRKGLLSLKAFFQRSLASSSLVYLARRNHQRLPLRSTKMRDGYKSDLALADDGLYDGDQPFGVAPKSSLPLLEIEEEEEGGEEHEKPTMERRDNKPSRAADMYLKVSFPLLGFFTKYTSLNFFRGKTNTDHTVLRRQGTSHDLHSGAGMSDTPAGRQESSSNLLRNPSRVLSTDQKLRMASFLGNTTRSQNGGKPVQIGRKAEKNVVRSYARRGF